MKPLLKPKAQQPQIAEQNYEETQEKIEVYEEDYSRIPFDVPLENWQNEIVQMGISPEIIYYAQMELSSDKTSVRYRCAYPPKITSDGKVLYPYIYRTNTLPSELKRNPNAQRFKNPPAENCPDGRMPLFYAPDYEELRKEVQKNNGKLILVEGISDVWTWYTAGTFNVVGLISGGTPVNEEFAIQLKELGTKTIDFYPDLDNTGFDVAHKVAQVLEKSKITCKAWALPFYAPNGNVVKDSRDLWNGCNRDRSLFASIVSRLQQLKTETFNPDDELIFTDEYYGLIEDKMEVGTRKPNSWSGLIKCPSEEEIDANGKRHKPAFNWNFKKKFGYCFRCGRSFNAKEIGEIFEIDWKKYLKPVTAQTNSEKTASNLNVSKSLLGGFNSMDYSQTPSSEFMYDFGEALDHFEKRLHGVVSSEFPPIQNPFKMIHHLGGMARVLQPPIMVGVLGRSGGFKTSFLTWITTELSRQGYNGIVFSPEWSPERNVDRIVQQLGGMNMSSMSLLERYYYEQAMIQKGVLNPEDESIFGTVPHEKDLLETLKVVRGIRQKFRGKIVYLKEFGSSIIEVLAQIEETAKRMTQSGHKPDYCIIDYAQLILPPQGTGAWWTIQNTITLTKIMTLKLGLITFMASQVRKSDTESLRDGESLLSSTSGLNFHDTQFNLFLTFNPTNEIFNLGDVRYKILKLAVTKNSGGDIADNLDTAIELYINLKKLVAEYDIDNPKPAFTLDITDEDVKEELTQIIG